MDGEGTAVWTGECSAGMTSVIKLIHNQQSKIVPGGFMSTEKINCPKCGTQMNHHADKPDRSAVLIEPGTVDPELAGILEVHACPACGNTEVRKSV